MVDKSVEKSGRESEKPMISTASEHASSLISKQGREETDDAVPIVTRSAGIETLKAIIRNDPDSTTPPMLPLSPSSSESSDDPYPITDSDDSLSTPCQTHSVSFRGIDSPASSLSLGEATVHEMMARIETLNDRLAQASVSLSGEKALRKKKEKTLVKLAKELHRRASDSQIKVAKVVELEETVSELRAKLETAYDDAQARQRKIDDDQEKYCAMRRDYDVRLAEARTQHETKCSELHGMVLRANAETERIRAKLAALESRLKKTGEERALRGQSPSTNKTEKRLLRASLVVTLIVAFAHYHSLTSVDSICGPAQPGMVFGKDEAVTMEAPWWAPDQFKENAFMICGDRTRSRLVWSEGKLSHYTLEKGNAKGVEIPTWNGRGFSILTGENKVSLHNRKGWVIEEIDLN